MIGAYLESTIEIISSAKDENGSANEISIGEFPARVEFSPNFVKNKDGKEVFSHGIIITNNIEILPEYLIKILKINDVEYSKKDKKWSIMRLEDSVGFSDSARHKEVFFG